MLNKDLFVESRPLKTWLEWKSQQEALVAERKDDIGRMLLTTSEATDGQTQETPLDQVATEEESKDKNVASPVKSSHKMGNDHSFAKKSSNESSRDDDGSKSSKAESSDSEREAKELAEKQRKVTRLNLFNESSDVDETPRSMPYDSIDNMNELPHVNDDSEDEVIKHDGQGTLREERVHHVRIRSSIQSVKSSEGTDSLKKQFFKGSSRQGLSPADKHPRHVTNSMVLKRRES